LIVIYLAIVTTPITYLESTLNTLPFRDIHL
jgi:hypothetical protein